MNTTHTSEKTGSIELISTVKSFKIDFFITIQTVIYGSIKKVRVWKEIDDKWTSGHP
jgi:hypothetical protein